MLKTNWTAEQAEFIKNNLEYLSTSCFTKMLNPLEMIYYNKYYCEEGDLIQIDGYMVQVYIGDKREDLFNIINAIDYDDFKKRIIDGLKELHLTFEEFKELKTLDMLGNNTYKWYKYTKNGISFSLQSSSDLPRILWFMEEAITGDEKAYDRVMEVYRRQYGYESDEFTFRDMKIKTFKNGRVDIKNCPKEVVDKFFRFEELFLQVYPDYAWSYRRFVEENKPTRVLKEYLC